MRKTHQSMEYNTIITILIGFFCSWETISNIRHRKEIKELKKNEVKKSTIDTQRDEMGLVEDYKNKTLEVVNLLHQLNTKQDTGSEKLAIRLAEMEAAINLKLTNIVRTQTSYNRRLSLVEKYLNGGLAGFTAEQKALKSAKA